MGSGFSALSPDQRFLLLSNLSTGADLYRLGQSTVIQSYPQVPDSARNFPLAVSFLHKGGATICGATRGDVSIRQALSGEHQQTLEHGGWSCRLAACDILTCFLGDLVQVLCVSECYRLYLEPVTPDLAGWSTPEHWFHCHCGFSAGPRNLHTNMEGEIRYVPFVFIDEVISLLSTSSSQHTRLLRQHSSCIDGLSLIGSRYQISPS